ncbi:MAG TPA: ribokinase [Terriglobales bacterium]|nr:ribokinase [Terriglobales bacterium]
MRSHRIAVVGSYATGLTMRVQRFPSPGETVLAKGYRVDFGGKGSNQAVACARLGAKVSFIAKIGQDNFGGMALSLHREQRVDIDSVIQVPGQPTGVGFIVVDADGNNCITIDPGANDLLTADEVSQSLKTLTPEAVVLTQLEIPVEAAAAAMARGREKRALTILNPAPARTLPDSVLRLVDVLTPNQSEAKVLVGQSPDAAMEPEAAAQELLRRGVKQVVITQGDRGALIATADSSRHIPAIKVSAEDTTGAGDSFNAGLAVALSCGENLDDAVRFAVVTGGLAVTREGVVPSLPTRNEVLRFYRQQDQTPPIWLS